MKTVETPDVATVEIESVGGIEAAEFAFESGVTVLTGRNATNRTSILQSLMAALGSDDVSLKSDAERGAVTLSLGEETYTRTLERDDGHVRTGGDPYLDNPEVADLFAFLLESNEARRAVRTGEDLRELIMRPVDTAAIREEIEHLEAEKRRVDERLEELADLSTRREDLVRERTRLEDEIESIEADLADKRESLEELDASLEDSRERREALEDQLADLEDVRNDLERARTQLETERESLASAREEREELGAERADLPDDPSGRLSEIEAELGRLREHKRSLDATINQLGQVIQFNESVVDGENEAVLRALDGAGDDEQAVTDQLLPDQDRVVCWTCGTEVERDAVTDTLDSLRDLRRDTVSERRDVTDDIDELQAEQRELETVQSERERLDRRVDDVEDEIDRREESVADLQDAVDELEDRVADLEAAVAERDEGSYDEVLERHRAVNETEFELESLREELTETEAELDRVDERLAERDDLEDRREEIADELENQRTRIERLEADVVETFNDHMSEVLELLGYENIERIWIEPREREARDGRRTVTERVFDLHVVRGSESGTAYEDTVEHLSESEREVAGLVFALAGYLAHEVHETVPFVLLDSMEAIDSERIAALVEYFAEYAPYLVVALLEEDAAAVSERHERVQMG